MVRAILERRKTTTRRTIKPQPDFVVDGFAARHTPHDMRLGRLGESIRCPYGKPGDRLWVRETWKTHSTFDHLPPRDVPESNLFYAADEPRYSPSGSRWRPSIHMPRWASRITLEVTGVRVERLQDLREEDAIAEGVDSDLCRASIGKAPLKQGYLPICAFSYLWDQINGAGSWDANPWVWVVEFQRMGQ